MQQNQNQIESNKNKTTIRVSNIIESLIATQGGYYSDKLYALKLSEKYNVSFCDVKNISNIRWLVLGREHYFETTKEYPIANKRDLIQALEYDDNKAPFEGVSLHHIERINEQSHRVTFWIIRTEVFEALPVRPWLIFPESFLFANALNGENTLASLSFNDKTVFVAKTGQGISSGLKNSQTATIDNFAFATGSPTSDDQQVYNTIDNFDFMLLLYRGLKSLTYSHIKGLFVKAKKIQWHNYPWQTALIISIVVLSSYITLTSGWLMIKQYQLDTKLSEQVVKVDEALAIQKEYTEQLAWQEQLSTPLQDKAPYWNVWYIVLDTVSAGAKISALHFKNNKISLDGDTSNPIKATDILAKLSGNPYLEQPSFSKPVRKRRNKEEFSITFTFSKTKKSIDPPPSAPKKLENLNGGEHVISK